ncbi:hypothetical protein BCR44DRAFT_1439788 [Catenaria anguillulae PL171]|uniref:NAD(P)-binding protein n=1 Tax=Catenaria anguillulae PL171 TaxID=765915 RepID=A0A1Y2HDR1_9FUNG|nr:hypothetical protein BCR44DRAFT_1439788 [Catenaria anguillulae PL171]
MNQVISTNADAMDLSPSLSWLLTAITAGALATTTLLHLRFRHRQANRLAKRRGLHIVLVGASSGVGEQLAYQYASRGARLVLAARRESLLASVREQCLTDVTCHADLRNLHTIATQCLDGHIDSVIYCVGALTICPFDATLAASDEQAANLIDQVFKVNATAPILLARLFLPSLRETALKVASTRRHSASSSRKSAVKEVPPHLQPNITVISSVAGLLPAPSRALYCASKAALHGFFDSLRIEERRFNRVCPVRVHLVAPGTIVGTDLRATALDKALWKDGMPVGSKKAGLSALQVAQEVVRQVDEVLVLPKWYEAAVVLRAIVPGVVDYMAGKKYQ